MMDKTRIEELIFRHFSGKTSPSEEKEIYDYVSSDRGNRQFYEECEADWKRNRIPTMQQREAFVRLKAEIGRRRRVRGFRYLLASLGAAAAVAAICLLFTLGGKEQVQPVLMLVNTDYCEKAHIVLPDSTEVWLNAATEISWQENFNGTAREVSMTGEAFFDVTSDPERPFIVKVGDSRITVKGTRFNVTSYSGEDEISAALLEGKIIFENDNVQVDMKPGELLTYNTATAGISKTTADVECYAAWIGGKLDYPGITLEKLFERLSSIYGVDIKYHPDKYKDKKFRIILNDNEPIENILDAVSFIMPIEYDNEGGVIEISEINN